MDGEYDISDSAIVVGDTNHDAESNANFPAPGSEFVVVVPLNIQVAK
jgi:phosphoglycolate phosphatase-like HAD superfamily hydrolase